MDFMEAFGFIYVGSDDRFAPDEKEDSVSSYAEEAGEHRDNKTVDAPFDYTAKFIIEAPNKDLECVNVKVNNFNRAVRDYKSNSDVKSKKVVSFYNLRKRVKIVGVCAPIATPTKTYHSDIYGDLEYAEVELKIRVTDPHKCDFELNTDNL